MRQHLQANADKMVDLSPLLAHALVGTGWCTMGPIDVLAEIEVAFFAFIFSFFPSRRDGALCKFRFDINFEGVRQKKKKTDG